MFLLILESLGGEIPEIGVFTFQYVSINTKENELPNYLTLLFTFQYVSINTFFFSTQFSHPTTFTFQYVSINT